MFLSQVNPLFEKLRAGDETLAVINQQGEYSYAELGRRVAAITARIEPWRGQTVLIYGHKQLDAVAAMLAAILHNCCFTFVDEANPLSRVQKIAAMSEAVLILNTGDSSINDIKVNAQIMTASLPDGDTAQLLLPERLTQPLFYILSTSGSTGEPKGVQITYNNFAAFNAWFGDEVTRNPAGSHVNHACLSFDMGILDLFTPLCRHKTVIMLDHKNNMLPRQNIRLMLRNAQKPVSGCFFTPGFTEIMLKDSLFNASTFPCFTHFFIGGERVSPGLVQALQQRFPDMTITHGYGPTETTCLTHTHELPRPPKHESGLLPLGKTKGQNQIAIVDAEGHALPAGTTGEVRIYGPQVAQGYLPLSHPRNVAFGCDSRGRYYATGDKGYLNQQGALFICGRDDGQLKLNGNRIEIAEIETAAYGHKNVMQCCLAVSEHEHSGQQLHLFVQLRDDSPARHTDFRCHLAQCLPANMIPRSVIFKEHFPMTLHGKIDKEKLIAEYKSPKVPNVQADAKNNVQPKIHSDQRSSDKGRCIDRT